MASMKVVLCRQRFGESTYQTLAGIKPKNPTLTRLNQQKTPYGQPARIHADELAKEQVSHLVDCDSNIDSGQPE
jgi:hypothetical protein